MRICSIEGCERNHFTKGLCNTHDGRQRRGIPLDRPITKRGGNPELRFWPKVMKTNSCWLWTGSISRTGYGEFRWKRKLGKAHRYAYIVACGEIPIDLELDHLCRIRNCVRYDHLEAVTNYENWHRGQSHSAIVTRDKEAACSALLASAPTARPHH